MGGTTQPYCSSSFKPLRTAMVACLRVMLGSSWAESVKSQAPE